MLITAQAFYSCENRIHDLQRAGHNRSSKGRGIHLPKLTNWKLNKSALSELPREVTSSDQITHVRAKLLVDK